MDLDTDVLILGAGLSGLGLAVQLVRQYGLRNFELIEKTDHIGGTWLANSYPGCGVDVRCRNLSPLSPSIILHVFFPPLSSNQLAGRWLRIITPIHSA
jgi:Predicted flavoprotein involved in K+ transport